MSEAASVTRKGTVSFGRLLSGRLTPTPKDFDRRRETTNDPT